MSSPWQEFYVEDSVEWQLRLALDSALKLAFMTDDSEVNERVQALASLVADVDAVKAEAASLDISPVEVGRPNLHLIPGGDAS